jgi:hypothetical protein
MAPGLKSITIKPQHNSAISSIEPCAINLGSRVQKKTHPKKRARPMATPFF